MKDRNTIKDVAKSANVSIATVSRVLNKSTKVSPEAKRRVTLAMKELNYRPNSLARSLKFKKTSSIGFLVSDISNPFFTQIMKGVEDVIQTHDYTLLVCSTDNSPDKEISYLKILMEKKVDGIVLNTTGGNDEYIASVSQEIPVVLSNRSIEHEGFTGDFVDNDNIGGAYMLTTHLIELGHRDIGVINGDSIVSTGRERFAGFIKAMKTIGINAESDYSFRFDGNFTSGDGYRGAEKLMTAEKKPTAIVVMNNEMTIGALRYFKEKNIAIPDEVSIVAFGDLAQRELLYLQPTLVSHNNHALGNKLGELLLERIESGKPINNHEFRYSSGLLLGNSTKKINSF